MAKSPDAFRTISEVADWLGVQAHVLRFWESKFAQVKPIKRAGGRRYYRPADMLLLGGIKRLLHDDGMTIKGTQKLLREKGVAHVADLSQPLDDLTMAVIEGDAAEVMQSLAFNATEEDNRADAHEETVSADEDAGQSVSAEPLFAASDKSDGTGGLDEDVDAEAISDSTGQDAEIEEAASDQDMTDLTALEHPGEDAGDEAPWLEKSIPPGQDAAGPGSGDTAVEPDPDVLTAQQPDEIEAGDEGESSDVMPAMPSFRARHRIPASRDPEAEAENAEMSESAQEQDTAFAPAFSSPAAVDEESPQAQRKPAVVDLPPVPLPSEIDASPSLLTALASVRRLSPEHAREIKPHVARLTRLRASMANALRDIHKD